MFLLKSSSGGDRACLDKVANDLFLPFFFMKRFLSQTVASGVCTLLNFWKNDSHF